MKNNKRLMILFSVVTIIIMLGTIMIYHFFILPPSAQKIYNKASQSVVELKAQSGDDVLSYGTGEIISSDGKLITNSHVITYSKLGQITEFEKYYLRFAFEEDFREVELIKYDIDLDIALLKIIEMPSFKLKYFKFGDSDKLNYGEQVYAVGNAQNHGIGIIQGIITVPKIKIEYQERTIEAIKCDLIINEGNSGGALLNKKGRLIGITTFRLKDNSNNIVYGVAYSIPINAVITFIK